MTAIALDSTTMWFIRGLESAGLRSDDGRVVFHGVDPRRPRPYRRRSRAVFVVGIAALEAPPADVLRTGYPLLVRSLSNIMILLMPGRGGRLQACFVTLERGYYTLGHGGDDAAFFAAVAERLRPLATSTLVIDNEFHDDLPRELWDGDRHTRAMERAGRRLAALDLLPAPFPIERILSPRDYRHVQRLFGLGGLSYGNMSVRHDARRFWMTASGVDKSNVRVVGSDILLVSDFDAARGVIHVSVPPDRPRRRVSVDAIEHLMIYREHPAVGAVVHVHCWMQDVPSTDMNYPCGTLELAQEVASVLRGAPDPARAVVGLRNHGLTITGPDLDDIFARMEGRVIRQVPML
jgi:ribulose-5-phosphate 4-epimerase/fuculose-1-phosphate aldolase